MYKRYRVFIIAAFSLFLLAGCSTAEKMIGWVKFWDERQADTTVTGEDMSRFVAGTRSKIGNPEPYYLLAVYYQERGFHKKAVVEFKKAIYSDPSYIKAYNGLGVSYDQLGNFSEAEEYYRRALRVNPDLDYVLNNMGYSYIQQGRISEAIEALQKAVALKGQNKLSRNNLGLAYAKNGQFDRAFNEFTLAKDEASAHFYIGQLYYGKGLYMNAKDHFLKAISKEPSLDKAKVWVASIESMADTELTEQTEVMGPVPDDYADGEASVTDLQSIDIETSEDVAGVHENISPEGDDDSVMAGIEMEKMKQFKPRNEAGIEISNGNGIRRMARRVGGYLNEYGYNVVRLTNADHFNHTDTVILYKKEYLPEAYKLAEQMPGNQDMRKIDEFERPDVKVKVLIGKDIVPYDRKTFGG